MQIHRSRKAFPLQGGRLYSDARKAEVLADGGIAPVAAAYRLEFLKGGMNAVIRAWLENGCRESEEELLDMLTASGAPREVPL